MKEMYFKVTDAVRELRERQSDEAFCAEVSRFCGDNCPVPSGHFGFLARHIATCSFEDLSFAQVCRRHNLTPFWLEFLSDQFCSTNQDKMKLVKLKLFLGVGRRGGLRLRNLKIVEQLERWERVPLKKVLTVFGMNLPNFHHKLRQSIGWYNDHLDISDWLWQGGKERANKFYEKFFALFLTRGILFESFDVHGFYGLQKFKQTVVIPAWEKVSKKFGKPLIVWHPPQAASTTHEKRMIGWYPGRIIEIPSR